MYSSHYQVPCFHGGKLCNGPTVLCTLQYGCKPLHQYCMVSQDLLEEMIQKKSKDPFGTIRVARKALSRIRYECLQRWCGKLCVEQAVHA